VDDAQSLVIPGCGRFVAEDAHNEMLAALTAFLADWDGPPRRTIPGRVLPGS
jgi:hypothetical protein